MENILKLIAQFPYNFSSPSHPPNGLNVHEVSEENTSISLIYFEKQESDMEQSSH